MPNWKNLKILLEDRGKAAKLSQKTGISTGNISDWKSGRSCPSANALVKIADVYNCSVDYLLGRTNIREMNSDTPSFTKIYRFPVYPQSAAAGVGVLGHDSIYSLEDFQIDDLPDEAAFAMQIEGESMYIEEKGHIKDGAIVLIDPKETEHDEKIVIANIEGKILCKRYYEFPDHIELRSDNKDHRDEDRIIRDTSCGNPVIGHVLGVLEDGKFIRVE